jgi:hypothetical protein
VGEVAAVGQGQAQEGVAGAGQSVEDGGVGLRPGVRLDIGADLGPLHAESLGARVAVVQQPLEVLDENSQRERNAMITWNYTRWALGLPKLHG